MRNFAIVYNNLCIRKENRVVTMTGTLRSNSS